MKLLITDYDEMPSDTLWWSIRWRITRFVRIFRVAVLHLILSCHAAVTGHAIPEESCIPENWWPEHAVAEWINSNLFGQAAFWLFIATARSTDGSFIGASREWNTVAPWSVAILFISLIAQLFGNWWARRSSIGRGMSGPAGLIGLALIAPVGIHLVAARLGSVSHVNIAEVFVTGAWLAPLATNGLRRRRELRQWAGLIGQEFLRLSLIVPATLNRDTSTLLGRMLGAKDRSESDQPPTIRFAYERWMDWAIEGWTGINITMQAFLLLFALAYHFNPADRERAAGFAQASPATYSFIILVVTVPFSMCGSWLCSLPSWDRQFGAGRPVYFIIMCCTIMFGSSFAEALWMKCWLGTAMNGNFPTPATLVTVAAALSLMLPGAQRDSEIRALKRFNERRKARQAFGSSGQVLGDELDPGNML
jgi:hypothetical protein